MAQIHWIWAAIAFFNWATCTPLAASNLRIEYLEGNVVGMDVPQPRFFWTVEGDSRGTYQSAYQIVVATAPDFESGVVWDSGKVVSSKTIQITYEGSTLLSDTTYYWHVLWWGPDGVAPVSETASFDTALFDQGLWTGQWIGGFNQLRTEFNLDQAPQRARAYICGLGYNELYINGQKVGDAKLDPGWTTYVNRSLYTVHDVTSLLVEGENAVGVMLGNGWYGQGWSLPVSLLFQMTIDGQMVAESGSDWKGVQGPIIYDEIYNGETYDARLEQDGWTEANFDDSAWSNANIIEGPGGVLRAQMFPPIKVQVTLKPSTITNPAAGVYVYDFDQNFSGWCRLSVTGPAGTNVTLRHAEILQHDGSGMIYVDNLRTAKATDTYILKGNSSGEVYEPRFTYHGFRFVEMTGFPGTPTLENLECLHAYSSVQSNGAITFNDPVLNRIQSNILWGQQSNLMSVPTDCDQRDERRGWTADAHLASLMAMHNFDMGAFYTNWLQGLVDDEVNGALSDTSPYVDHYGNRPGDPSWTAALPMIMTEMVKQYGDTAIIEDHYQDVKNYIDFAAAKATASGLGKMYGTYGDWVPPPPGNKNVSIQFCASWYFMTSLSQFVNFANLVGNTTDANQYMEMLLNFMGDFNDAFGDSQNYYEDGQQTNLLLPLAFATSGLTGDLTWNLSVALLNDIGKHDTHLTTGILGTRYLGEVLSQIGRDDVALQLALRQTYPSWAYMFLQTTEAPATTLWELWDSPSEGPSMNSRNHVMFGSIGAWFYQGLAGIQQDSGFQTPRHFPRSEKAQSNYLGSVAYQNIVIQPPSVHVLLYSPLTSVSATLNTLAGQVASSWQRSGGVICASAPENFNLTIDCGGSTISAVDFASFGEPQGYCRNFAYGACHAQSTMKVLQQKCVGQTSCTILASDSIFGDPCYGNYKHLDVQATCSADPSFALQVNIPANADATIYVPTLAFSSPEITEGGSVIFQGGQFVPGVTGLSFLQTSGNYVMFSASSGNYSFGVTGVTNSPNCVDNAEGGSVQLQCSTGTIGVISYAFYGENGGSCGNYQYSNCTSGSTLFVVESECLGQSSCTVVASPEYFGFPCAGDNKQLIVEYICI
eukprot:TRINITY_DN2447_c0_g1_i1.p1 TRINITY_DN2447_c0_g1~~TRINITY_DN2447_c0_g1_i1.p1  ORF type:complete len:1110 (+),score=243.84 TRINITY_DN2447_c0_g1_i1:27-3332(+)